MIFQALIFWEIFLFIMNQIQPATLKTLFCKGFTALAMLNKEGHTDITELLKKTC